jgi:hypothetical protein
MGTYEMAAPTYQPREQLMARLDDPKTAEALNRLLDRLDLMVLAADSADEFLRRGDDIADSVSSSLAELKQVSVSAEIKRLVDHLPTLARAGVQLADLAASPAFARLLSSGLLERLAEPNTLAALNTVFDHMDLVSMGLQSADELLRRSDEITDNISDSIADVLKAAPDGDLGKANFGQLDLAKLDFKKIGELAGTLPVLVDLALQVSRSGLLDHARKMVDTMNELQTAGVFEHNAVAVVGEMGSAAVVAHTQREFAANAPKGIFGLMKALKDPDVQASLGFGIAFARNYGRKLRAGA